MNGVTVYVDGQSIELLTGSQIDYVDTLMGAGFTVNNPNAVSGCGCGSSFRTADEAGRPGAARTEPPARPTGRTNMKPSGEPGGFDVSGW